ncbi:MAG: NAD-dependent epimerase/dehydratase family protein [Anaerolineae bacterium]|nr:NAD-dependent epimerase/dehydratase family protein [Anaerolineae bacterium]
MKQDCILITGANGEIGHSLITKIYEQGNGNIVALDLSPLDSCLAECCCEFIQCNILDEAHLVEIFQDYHFTSIFHLASILSTRAEMNPLQAQKVNVQGTAILLELAAQQTLQMQYETKFIYPSSIAVYGFPTPEAKQQAGKVREDQALSPVTMYGINKLACENLGAYYGAHYRLLNEGKQAHHIDFRAIRFPGLISAITVPTGGTSDYGPEMLHHAAQGLPYNCFVRPDTRLPFMVMPDAVKSLLTLESAPRESLSQLIYNVTSFNPSAEQLAEITINAFPSANIHYSIHPARQIIVDSWPGDIDDSAARRDWGWTPDFDLEQAFQQYLIPQIHNRYHQGVTTVKVQE